MKFLFLGSLQYCESDMSRVPVSPEKQSRMPLPTRLSVRGTLWSHCYTSDCLGWRRVCWRTKGNSEDLAPIWCLEVWLPRNVSLNLGGCAITCNFALNNGKLFLSHSTASQILWFYSCIIKYFTLCFLTTQSVDGDGLRDSQPSVFQLERITRRQSEAECSQCYIRFCILLILGLSIFTYSYSYPRNKQSTPWSLNWKVEIEIK
jgi:hypothetical protein